jgi:hypothetical protein
VVTKFKRLLETSPTFMPIFCSKKANHRHQSALFTRFHAFPRPITQIHAQSRKFTPYARQPAASHRHPAASHRHTPRWCNPCLKFNVGLLA